LENDDSKPAIPTTELLRITHHLRPTVSATAPQALAPKNIPMNTAVEIRLSPVDVVSISGSQWIAGPRKLRIMVSIASAANSLAGRDMRENRAGQRGTWGIMAISHPMEAENRLKNLHPYAMPPRRRRIVCKGSAGRNNAQQNTAGATSKQSELCIEAAYHYPYLASTPTNQVYCMID